MMTTQNEAAINKRCNAGDFSGHFFPHFCEIDFFCIVVDMCDLVHNLETIFNLNSIWKSRKNM